MIKGHNQNYFRNRLRLIPGLAVSLRSGRIVFLEAFRVFVLLRLHYLGTAYRLSEQETPGILRWIGFGSLCTFYFLELLSVMPCRRSMLSRGQQTVSQIGRDLRSAFLRHLRRWRIACRESYIVSLVGCTCLGWGGKRRCILGSRVFCCGRISIRLVYFQRIYA